MSSAGFSRVYIEFIVQGQASGIGDYALGEYIATEEFFKEINNLQTQIIAGEEVKLNTGQVIDPKSVGGLLAIQMYMETLDSSKQTMSGLAKLGLSVERQSWKTLSS